MPEMQKSKKFVYLSIAVLVLVVFGASLFLYFSKPANEGGKIKVSLPAGSSMLLAECSDATYRANKADWIIEGTVVKVESKKISKWIEGKGTEEGIFTYSDIKIEKYIKGTPFAEDTLQIETPGGIADGISQWVEDMPIFENGTKVRIYLSKTPEGFSIVCGVAGVESVGERLIIMQ